MGLANNKNIYFHAMIFKEISFGLLMYGKVNGAELTLHCEWNGLMEQSISKGKSCCSDIINGTLAPLMNLPLIKKQPAPFCSENEILPFFF